MTLSVHLIVNKIKLIKVKSNLKMQILRRTTFQEPSSHGGWWPMWGSERTLCPRQAYWQGLPEAEVQALVQGTHGGEQGEE